MCSPTTSWRSTPAGISRCSRSKLAGEAGFDLSLTGFPTEPWYLTEARNVYRTIEAFGWDITWRSPNPIPDDRWYPTWGRAQMAGRVRMPEVRKFLACAVIAAAAFSAPTLPQRAGQVATATIELLLLLRPRQPRTYRPQPGGEAGLHDADRLSARPVGLRRRSHHPAQTRRRRRAVEHAMADHRRGRRCFGLSLLTRLWPGLSYSL